MIHETFVEEISQEQPQSPVNSVLEILDREMEILNSVVGKLETVISPVLTNEPCNPVERPVGSVREEERVALGSSKLVSQVGKQYLRAVSLRRRLVEIIDRIEL